jgi:3-oxoadipate enol-lactonase / 4-carboxymuconolactone decarboxylase
MNIHYEFEGATARPVLMLSHSLGADLSMWDDVLPHLHSHFSVLRYDMRGHGSSVNVGANDDNLSIADLGRDVLDLMDHLGIESAIFCGLSIGGLIGQWLGIHAPNRLQGLILANTAAKIGNDDTWNTRIAQIEANSLSSIVDATMERWFSDAFRSDHPARIEQAKQVFLSSHHDTYLRCCAAIRDVGFRENLSQIPVKTLIIAGENDPVTEPEQAQFLQDQIPDVQLVVLPAKHISAVECAPEFAEALLRFAHG